MFYVPYLAHEFSPQVFSAESPVDHPVPDGAPARDLVRRVEEGAPAPPGHLGGGVTPGDLAVQLEVLVDLEGADLVVQQLPAVRAADEGLLGGDCRGREQRWVLLLGCSFVVGSERWRGLCIVMEKEGK